MKTPPAPIRRPRTPLTLAALLTLSASLSLCGGAAQAENRALILSIDYVGSLPAKQALPFTNNDADDARKIAVSMGVSEANITQYKNSTLDAAGFRQAFQTFSKSVQPGDKVFIYYSGHGMQINGIHGSKCTEGMVTHDLDLIDDAMLQGALSDLSHTASQVVMFNDSCFSGGAATKSMVPGEVATPKYYVGDIKSSSKETDPARCGAPVNKAMRAMKDMSDKEGKNVLYIAASANNEVSYGDLRGSFATRAWASCLARQGADANRSGLLNGDELAACARTEIKRIAPQVTQTITLVGNTSLPLSMSAPTQAGDNTPVEAVNLLEDISHGADPAYRVSLSVNQPTMRIKQDYLDFSVSTARAGYLYVFQIGSDGETFNLLYPNAFDGKDGSNRIEPGTVRLPRDNWRIRSGGPVGTSYLLAFVSPTPRNFLDDKNLKQAFRSAPAKASATRTLFTEANNADNSSSGEYGASAVVPVREIQ